MKVLIVDDEQHIVEYLKYILDWEKLGFSEVVTATSSTKAREYLMNSHPELLLTDIRMPQISGLDLAESISDAKLDTKVIILSGYSEFSYAQKAIRLGTVDYLIKPISKNDLLPVVRRALSSISNSSFNKSLNAINNNLFFIEALSTLNISNSIEKLGAADYRIAWLNKVTAVDQALNLRLRERYLTVFSADNKAISIGAEIYPFSREKLQTLFYDYFEINVAGYHFPDALLSLIKKGSWEDVRDYIGERPSWGKNELLLIGIDLLAAFGKTFPQINRNISLSTLLTDEIDIVSYLFDFLTAYLEVERDEGTRDKYSEKSMEKIIAYIEENYGEDITLDVLSGVVHMHPVTISRLFKATTGSMLTTFLVKTRMEAAANLMAHSNLLVGDVAQMVGYHKTQYFINLFKKNYGLTPQKYRRKIQLEGEK